MIAPTGIYKNFPTSSPDEAAELVASAILTRQPEVSTRLGKLGETVNTIAPGLLQFVMTGAYHVFPETAGKEALQWDGLHGRWDEQPSGFAPYELARLAKDTGGIYFLLPSEEEMRVRQREKAYSMTTLKEYVPDYESRAAYYERIGPPDFLGDLHQCLPHRLPSAFAAEIGQRFISNAIRFGFAVLACSFAIDSDH